jgi:hypothetical protein
LSLQAVFYLLGTILLVLEAVGIRPPRVSLGWLGLACWLFAFGVLPAIRS